MVDIEAGRVGVREEEEVRGNDGEVEGKGEVHVGITICEDD
jgi:hypothetical protein